MALLKNTSLNQLFPAVIAVFFSISVALVALPVNTEAARTFIFPVIGQSTYTNDYHAPRQDGIHEATDIFAAKHSRLVAMADGTINWVASPEPSWGFSLSYTDDHGYTFTYIHINNDTPGTDNGSGGEMFAYAADVAPGNRIVAGQLLGYLGDSGNAEETPAHLHLEIQKPDNTPKNPYLILKNQTVKINSPVPGPDLPNEILPFGTARRDIDIAAGNFDLDSSSEVVTAVNSNGIAKVKIYDGDETVLGSFNTYVSSYRGGINIGTGDVDNDGIDEVIVGRNGNGRVRVYALDGTLLTDFFAFSRNFRGDTRVAAGDVDGDDEDEIIAAVGNKANARVKVFELDGTLLHNWLAYTPSDKKNGLFVAAGDLDGDLTDEVVVSVGRGSWPRIKIFEADGTLNDSFYAFHTSYKGGVRVDVGDVDPSNPGLEILAILANDGSPRVNMFASDGTFLRANKFIESWWIGSYDVAAGEDYGWAAAFGNRRGSIRYGID